MSLRIVMLGDIVGMAGLEAVRKRLPDLRQRWRPDIVLVNAENASNGSGLTPTQYKSLREAGVDGVTLGDHAFRRKQIVKTMEGETRLIRPANLSARAAGRGWMRVDPPRGAGESAQATHEGAASEPPPGPNSVYVTTVLGRIYMNLPANDPFATVDAVLSQLPQKQPLVVVEIHAEATSEKRAIGWYLDGRVTAVLGSHTHVPTADAQILPNGTGYITDLGMCGPHRSVLGRAVEPVVKFMSTAMPNPFDIAEGDVRLNGVFLEIDPQRGRCTGIERIEVPA
jgi:hypothetical protein